MRRLPAYSRRDSTLVMTAVEVLWGCARHGAPTVRALWTARYGANGSGGAASWDGLGVPVSGCGRHRGRLRSGREGVFCDGQVVDHAVDIGAVGDGDAGQELGRQVECLNERHHVGRQFGDDRVGGLVQSADVVDRQMVLGEQVAGVLGELPQEEQPAQILEQERAAGS